MNIYISGISGTAMGALALFLKKAGFYVSGSDRNLGAVSEELAAEKIEFRIGNQDGSFLMEQFEAGKIDWFVYTSALKNDHPELMLAKKLGVKVSKRDELIRYLTEKLKLKMVAVAGTHGKTTTTAMIIWGCLKLGLPVAWLEGTTLGFAPAGLYENNSKYLIYEADEYDKNFLAYHPWLSAITIIDYDHPDIYPTRKDYSDAFSQFKTQSRNVIENAEMASGLTLAGEVRRKDASLALLVVQKICEDLAVEKPVEKLVEILNQFPGSGRRFEKIAKNVYSDYAHHPEEIRATINVAQEEAANLGLKGVVVVYEPHQNTRQHEVKNDYKDCFAGSEKIFWLPTFLTRENPDLKILSPEDMIQNLSNSEKAEATKLDEPLAKKLIEYQKNDFLILLMTAGPADGWLRKLFGNS